MAPPSANPLAQDSRLQVDAVVAHRYRVVAHARACGFGQVYEVEDEVTGTQVGLMRLAPEFAQDGVRERFIDRRLSATLDDPRVVDVLDLGEDLDGRLYLVMPWIEGETLLDRLDRESPLPWAIARDLMVEIAGALSAAHEVGLVHGALDPQRVLLPKEGGVMVVDFGLAASLPANPLDAGARQGRSETLTNVLPGDPRYLAPEQIRGEAGDIRSDVYALGVLAWELVSGTPPFGAGSLVEVVQAQLEAPLPELVRLGGAPVEIEALLHLALAKAPDERFASVEEFAVTLGALDASSRRTMVPRSSVPTGAHRALTGRHTAVSTKPRKAGARRPKPRKPPASKPASPASRATMVAGSAPSSDSAAVKGSVSLGEQATMLSEGLTSRPSRPSTKLEKRKPPKLKPRRPPDGVQPRKHTQSAQVTEAVPVLDMEAIEAEERRKRGRGRGRRGPKPRPPGSTPKPRTGATIVATQAPPNAKAPGADERESSSTEGEILIDLETPAAHSTSAPVAAVVVNETKPAAAKVAPLAPSSEPPGQTETSAAAKVLPLAPVAAAAEPSPNPEPTTPPAERERGGLGWLEKAIIAFLLFDLLVFAGYKIFGGSKAEPEGEAAVAERAQGETPDEPAPESPEAQPAGQGEPALEGAAAGEDGDAPVVEDGDVAQPGGGPSGAGGGAAPVQPADVNAMIAAELAPEPDAPGPQRPLEAALNASEFRTIMVDARQKMISKCLDTKMRRTIKISVKVTPAGEVSYARIIGDQAATSLGTCILEQVYRLEFPATHEGGTHVYALRLR